MRTFLTVPFSEYPGFRIPSPSAFCGRGFFKLDRSGVRVTEPDPIVDPLDMVVMVVVTDWTLPLMLEYGRPLALVTAMPVGEIRKSKVK